MPLIYPYVNRGMGKKLHLPRDNDPIGLIIHTTGSGPWSRQRRYPRFDTPGEAAVYMYERGTHAGPHYVVCGERGTIWQGTPDDHIAWHVGGDRSWVYKAPGWDRKCKWWKKRWPEYSSPRDLLGGSLWREGSANKLTLGIDVAPPLIGPRAPWTDACWKSLSWLTNKLCLEYGIIHDSEHIFTHSDAHPRKRTTDSGKPWDPAKMQWEGRQSVYRLTYP